MADPTQDLKASFFVECDELIEALQDGLRELSEGTGDCETVNSAFRAVHSIKGTAGAFGLSDLVGFAHVFETALDGLRQGGVEATADILRIFYRGADLLSDLVAAGRGGAAPDPIRIAGVVDALDGLTADPAPAAEMRHFRIAFEPVPDLYRRGHEPLFFLRELEAFGDTVVTCRPTPCDIVGAGVVWTIGLDTAATRDEVVAVFGSVEGLGRLSVSEVDLGAATSVAEPPAPPPIAVPGLSGLGSAETPSRERPAPQSPTVRVDLDRIDRLMNLVGELVINQAMLSQSLSEAELSVDNLIGVRLSEFQQLTRDIQEGVMLIRAQPVKSLFNRMVRTVREAGDALGKDVRLVTEGEMTEVDSTVIERLADPLTHMVRNAIDHGIEAPEARVGAGKPAQGTIRLSAEHRAGRIVIELADDGSGIDRDKVQRRAVADGLVPDDRQLTESEIDEIMFHPGFSTATRVSALSGRGVGMDVVKSAITALGGRVAVRSTPGAGTGFSISLPLTLAVLDGTIVEVAGETLVVPLGAMSETLILEPGAIHAPSPDRRVVHLRDGIVPLLDLGAALGFREPPDSLAGKVALITSRENGSRIAIVVDAIEDQRQVVIKSFEAIYGHMPGIAAATILGNGRIALIVDPADLVAPPAGRQPTGTPLAPTG